MLLSESGKVCTREDSIAYMSPIRAIDFLRGASKNPMGLGLQVAWLLVLGIPVACIYCQQECVRAQSLICRKFFYLFTCEYCFSHYVPAVVLLVVLQVVVHELARISSCLLRSRLGGQPVHEHLQPSPPGN
jgi:hypothetical protein